MPVLGIVREFNATHGKTKHEHIFKVEVQFKTEIINAKVQNVDLDEIIPQVEKVVNSLKGVYINEFLNDRGTLENIAMYILTTLENIKNIYSVKVFELSGQYAIIGIDEL